MRDGRKKLFGFLSFFLTLIILPARSEEDITAKVWLFLGIGMEDQAGAKAVEIFSGISRSELVALKTLAGGPADEFKAAAIDALMDIKNLKSLEDLFAINKTWNEDRPFISDSVVARERGYRIDLFFHKTASAPVATRAVLSRTKDGILREEKDRKRALENAYAATQDEEKMEIILDYELQLPLDYPFVLAAPYKEGIYFIIIMLTAAKPEAKPMSSSKEKKLAEVDLAAAPNAIREVRPFYPEELQRRGVNGTVGLRLTIDEKGNVNRAEVLAPLHPYLDYTAVLAFRQWTFEPVLQKGKPVRAKFTYAANFNPRLYTEEVSRAEEAPVVAGQSDDLRRILTGCAEYCRKLADSALFFICEETIKETHHQLKHSQELNNIYFKHEETIFESPDGMKAVLVRRVQIMDPNRTERKTFTCDYQLIKKGESIEQQRIVLKEDGRVLTDRTKRLEEKRYAVLKPIFAALQVLAPDRQSRFDFRLLGEERIRGRDVYILEAVPKSGNADGVLSAKLWVEQSDFRILKSEITGVPIDGYEDVLKDCIFLNIEPDFVTTHEYRIERNGVFFPESSSVKVGYRGLVRGRPVSKLKTDLSYGKYKFFTVETGHQVIK